MTYLIDTSSLILIVDDIWNEYLQQQYKYWQNQTS